MGKYMYMYARLIGFCTKNSLWLCNVYVFIYQKIDSFYQENNAWLLIMIYIRKCHSKRFGP